VDFAGLEDRRPVDGEAVEKLAESMKDIGLQHPITRAREDDAKRKPKVAASAALPFSGGLSYSWQGVRVGGPVLTARLETGP
jgi:hypothetical protein